MTNNENTTEIIDIAPEDIVEGKVEEQTKPRGKSNWRRNSLLTVGLVALSAVGGGWVYRDLLSSYLPSDQVQGMTTRMDSLEATTKTLNGKVEAIVGFTDEIKSQLTAAQGAMAEVASLQTESAQVKSSVAELNKALASANSALEDLKAQIAGGGSLANGTGELADGSAYAARIEALEKDVTTLKQAGKAAVDTTLLSQSLADLKAKIAAGTSYKDEIDRVALMVPAAEGLDILQSHAAQGLPNAQGLAAELKLTALKLPKPEPAAPADNSWWGYAGTLMSELVTIKTDGAEDWEQVAVHAATLSEQGDLAAAVANLDKLDGALPVELQNWHERATARLDIERAVEKTSAAVLRQIAAKG